MAEIPLVSFSNRWKRFLKMKIKFKNYYYLIIIITSIKYEFCQILDLESVLRMPHGQIEELNYVLN